MYVSVERIVSEDESGKMHIEELSLENTQYVRISLLTDDMIKYDLEMFTIQSRTNLLHYYRPYFVSFIVPLEENKLRNIEVLGDDWHIGQFVNSEEMMQGEDILLNGILETSASPINCLNKSLLVFTNRAMKKDVLDTINDTYNPHNFAYTSSLDIETVLNDCWEGDIPKTIDIYNVGHGNADYIKGSSNHRIIYDIGYNYRSFPKYNNSGYLRAVNAIRHLKPSCVILSHWDMDHIIGCAYAEQSVFDKKWIAPYLVSDRDKKATPNSIRLAHYLSVLGNLCLVDREQKNKLVATIECGNNICMKLWLGGGTGNLTSKNREGLIIEIIDTYKVYPHILLAGDVPYKCMPDILKEPINFIHVPHHCSNMDLDKLKKLPGRGICAVISTNRKRDGTLNYDNNHKMELSNKFMNVINTIDNASGDDEANLSVQIDYRYSDFRFR